MLFGDRGKNSGFGLRGFDDNAFIKSFDGTVIDSVDKIEDNILLDDLCVSGSALFLGEVDADRIVISGHAEFREFATCDDLYISGSAVMKSEVVCESIIVSGEARMHDTVHADLIISDGFVKTNRRIKTINLNINGVLEGASLIYADKIDVQGSLNSGGEMKCFELTVNSDKPSVVGRLQADKLITVNRKPDDLDFVLNCDFADCGTVNIEYAKIDYLRCDRCRIGQGCVIGKLDCSEDAEISPDAMVDEFVGKISEVL